jgi:hypothetical protein
MKPNQQNRKYRLGKALGLVMVATVIAVLTFSMLHTGVAIAKKAKVIDTDSEQTKTKATPAKAKDSPKEIKPEKGERVPAEIMPMEVPDSEETPSAVMWDKGRQIKWQIICSSGGCGASSPQLAFLDFQVYFGLCGSLGQVAVGQGTSPSFGINQGFWQENLSGFVRGDCNGDGVVGPADVVYLLNYLFRAGPAPDPLWVGECNCDDIVGPADIVFLINYLFRGGPLPEC